MSEHSTSPKVRWVCRRCKCHTWSRLRPDGKKPFRMKIFLCKQCFGERCRRMIDEPMAVSRYRLTSEDRKMGRKICPWSKKHELIRGSKM